MWNIINGEVPQTLKDHFSIRRRNCRQTSTYHLETQTFSNEILLTKDQNVGTIH